MTLIVLNLITVASYVTGSSNEGDPGLHERFSLKSSAVADGPGPRGCDFAHIPICGEDVRYGR